MDAKMEYGPATNLQQTPSRRAGQCATLTPRKTRKSGKKKKSTDKRKIEKQKKSKQTTVDQFLALATPVKQKCGAVKSLTAKFNQIEIAKLKQIENIHSLNRIKHLNEGYSTDSELEVKKTGKNKTFKMCISLKLSGSTSDIAAKTDENKSLFDYQSDYKARIFDYKASSNDRCRHDTLSAQ